MNKSKVTQIVLVVSPMNVLCSFELEPKDKIWATCDGYEVYLRLGNEKLSRHYDKLRHAALIAIDACGGSAGKLHMVKERPKKRGNKAFQAMQENSERMF